MIRRLAGSRLLRLFSTSVIDQALLSGANFLVGLLLIRYTTDHDYGYFVLAQAAVQLLINAQSAWVSMPLSVLAPKQTPERRRQMVGAVEAAQRRLLRTGTLIAMTVPPAGYLLGLWPALIGLVIAASIVAGHAALTREYSRSLLFVFTRPHTVLAVDAAYVAALLALIAFAAAGPGPAAVWAVLAIAGASWVGGFFAHRSIARDPGWDAGADLGPIWRQMKPVAVWVGIGVIAYWIFSQSYNYLLAGKLSVVAVAEVNATRLLLSPVVMMTVGVRSLLLPSAARWLHESGLGPLLRKLSWFGAGLLLMDLIYIGLLWLARDWVVAEVLNKTLSDLDRMLLLWAALSLVGLVRDIYQCGALALERFRQLGWLTIAAAMVALTLSWFGIGRYGAAGALFGLLAGELLSLLGTLYFALCGVRRPRAAAGGAA